MLNILHDTPGSLMQTGSPIVEATRHPSLIARRLTGANDTEPCTHGIRHLLNTSRDCIGFRQDQRKEVQGT